MGYGERPSNAARNAWICLVGGVILYDVLCPEGQTLSEGVDHAIEKHPILTFATIGMTALHLLNILPPKLDIIHQLAKAVDKS